jgi:flagellar biosynthesis component FlhA
MTEQATTQLANPTALYMSAGILAVLGLVPGMPHLVFITLALASAGLAWRITQKQEVPVSSPAQQAAQAQHAQLMNLLGTYWGNQYGNQQFNKQAQLQRETNAATIAGGLKNGMPTMPDGTPMA